MKRVFFILLSLLATASIDRTFAQINDHGDNCATATTVELNSSTPGELTSNDHDFFLITLPAPDAVLTLSTTGEPPTTGRLFDANGILVAEDRFSPFLLSQRLPAGTYCVEVSGNTAATSGRYAVVVEADVPADDHGNSCETATPVGRTDIVGDISVYDDHDFFRVQVSEPGGELIFTAVTDGNLDIGGRLFDANGILVAEDKFSPFLIDTPLGPGVYCAEVFATRPETHGIYTFQVQGPIIPAGSCTAEHLALSIASFDFGQVLNDTLSAPQAVTLTNISVDPQHRLFLDPSTLSGTDAIEFGLLNDTCAGRVLAPGEQCTLRSLFAPLSEGPKTAVLMLPCNDPDSLPLQIPLTGESLPATTP